MTSTMPRASGTRRHRPYVRSRWVALALLASAQLMLVLDVTVVNVALPDIGVALHLQRGELPWVMTIYTVFFGGLMLLGGQPGRVRRDVPGATPRRALLVADFRPSRRHSLHSRVTASRHGSAVPLEDLATAAGFRIEARGDLPLLRYIRAIRPGAS
jgi:hypothetical protein